MVPLIWRGFRIAELDDLAIKVTDTSKRSNENLIGAELTGKLLMDQRQVIEKRIGCYQDPIKPDCDRQNLFEEKSNSMVSITSTSMLINDKFASKLCELDVIGIKDPIQKSCKL